MLQTNSSAFLKSNLTDSLSEMNQTRRVFNQNTLNELDHSIKTSNEMKFEEYDKLISDSIIQNMLHTNQESV
jgi:hypothetical protein